MQGSAARGGAPSGQGPAPPQGAGAGAKADADAKKAAGGPGGGAVGQNRQYNLDPELKHLMLGDGLNLAAVRARAQLLQSANEQPWSETVGQFAVLNVQIANLTSEVRPLLKHFNVYPTDVNAELAAELPLLLSTKLLPEMEAEDAAHLKTFRQRAAAAGALPAPTPGAWGGGAGGEYEPLQKRVDHYNGLCERADSLVQTLRKTQVMKRKRAEADSGRGAAERADKARAPALRALLYASHTGAGLTHAAAVASSTNRGPAGMPGGGK